MDCEVLRLDSTHAYLTPSWSNCADDPDRLEAVVPSVSDGPMSPIRGRNSRGL